MIDPNTPNDINVLLRNRWMQEAEMTLPDERYRAIQQTCQFLQALRDPAVYPRVPRAVRAEAHRLLRHYPSDWDLDRLAEKAPDVIVREMEPLTRMVMTYQKEHDNDDAS